MFMYAMYVTIMCKLLKKCNVCFHAVKRIFPACTGHVTAVEPYES